MALFATPANAGLQIEVRGVGEAIRANVLAYLSFERYKNSDDLSPEFVERLQERSEREVRGALRPFGYYEPTVTSDVKRESSGGDQNYRIVISITPGKPVMVDKVDVKVTGPGATDKLFTNITNDLPIQSGDTLNHSNYDTLKGSLLRAAATYGYLDARMVRNEMRVDPQAYVAQVTIEFETGPRYKFGEHHHQAEHDRRRAGAALPALQGRPVFRRLAAAAHPVRARRQPVFRHRRSAPRRARSRAAHGAGQHQRRAESPQSLLVRRGIWHRHPDARHGRLGSPAHQLARSPIPHRGPRVGALAIARRALHHSHRRSGHRKVHAAAHGRARAPCRHRRSHRQFHTEPHSPAALVVRRALVAARHLRRVPAHRIRIRRVGPQEHAVTADPRHQLRAGAQQLPRRGALQPHAVRGAARFAQLRSARIRTSCSSACRPSACSTSRRSGTCCCAATSAPPRCRAPPVSPPRNDSSPAAIAACAASASTTCRRWSR